MKYLTNVVFISTLLAPFLLSGHFAGLAIYIGILISLLAIVALILQKGRIVDVGHWYLTPNVVILTFLGFLIVLLPFSTLPIRSVPVIVWWLVFAVVFICSQCFVKDGKILENISKAFVVLTAGFGIVSIYNFIMVGLTSYTRLDGIVGTHNVYGGFLIIPFFLSLYLALVERGKWQKVLWYISSGVIFSSIILTFSRGTWVSIVLAIIVSVVLLSFPYSVSFRRLLSFTVLSEDKLQRESSVQPLTNDLGNTLDSRLRGNDNTGLRGNDTMVKYLFSLVILTLLMTCSIWYLAKQSTIYQDPAKLSTTAVFSQQNIQENAVAARLHYFEDAWDTFVHAPITGFGPGLYANALRIHKTDPNYGSFADPHNWFLKMLVENGLIVTIIFVIFIISLFWQMRQLIRGRKEFPWLAVVIFTGLVGGVIHGLMDFDWSMSLSLLVWFLFAGALYGFLLNTSESYRFFSKWISYTLLVLILIASVVSIQILRADLPRAKGDVYFLQMNNVDSAINSYFESVIINKYEPTTYYDLWRAYYSLKKYGVAKGLIEKAVTLMPQNGIYYGALARTELALGDYSNYREHLLKAIELFPASDLSYHVMLVDYDFQQKKYDEALVVIDGILPIYEKYQKALWYKNDPNSETISDNVRKLKELKSRIEKEIMKVR